MGIKIGVGCSSECHVSFHWPGLKVSPTIKGDSEKSVEHKLAILVPTLISDQLAGV